MIEFLLGVLVGCVISLDVIYIVIIWRKQNEY